MDRTEVTRYLASLTDDEFDQLTADAGRTKEPPKKTVVGAAGLAEAQRRFGGKAK